MTMEVQMAENENGSSNDAKENARKNKQLKRFDDSVNAMIFGCGVNERIENFERLVSVRLML
ncbi:hypothetical protein NECAME_14574 [Necator americanus]|uniref:Uncharacterized protein n=1 Tax=Necator americanus TaxID=51031 RepID=W2SPW9_NECAM|nr:hypothetical protein NECAME_14574 [Necator americanus]ETN70737.1 hypothetical protein NECAME_14574 [Necator americanus]